MESDGAASVADASLSESTVEAAALDWLAPLGWAVARGADIAPDTPAAERDDYGEVVLADRLRSALGRLNPDLSDDALDDALRRLTRPAGATLEARNRDFHRMFVAGVTVEYADADGIRGDQVRVLDFDDPSSNDWFAVDQFTVVENRHERRPDIVLFVNGLPLAVVELKNPADENATIHTAFRQLQTYKAEVPSLFAFNAALIVSDALEARIGTLTAGWEWFKRWRTITGETLADPNLPQLQVLLEGACDPHWLLALVRDFVVFEDDGSGATSTCSGDGREDEDTGLSTKYSKTFRRAVLAPGRRSWGSTVQEEFGRFDTMTLDAIYETICHLELHAGQVLYPGCDVPKINLQIRRSNADVVAFYRSIGYAEDDVVSMGKRLIED